MDNIRPLHKPAGGPAPVIALHSSGSSGRQWEGYRALLPAGAVLHTPDLLGYGEDAPPWPNGTPATLEAEAWRLLPLIMSQGRPVHLVGHSYGGAVALQAALLWPEQVMSLTLYEPVLFHLLFDDETSRLHAESIVAVGRRIGMLALSGRALEAAALFVGYWSGDAVWSAMPAGRRQAVIAKMSKVRADFEALFNARFDVRTLAAWGMPLRIIRGTKSPAPARRVADLLAQQVPHAELLTLEGAGHMAPVTQRELLAPDLFHWLSGRPMAQAA